MYAPLEVEQVAPENFTVPTREVVFQTSNHQFSVASCWTSGVYLFYKQLHSDYDLWFFIINLVGIITAGNKSWSTINTTQRKAGG